METITGIRRAWGHGECSGAAGAKPWATSPTQITLAMHLDLVGEAKIENRGSYGMGGRGNWLEVMLDGDPENIEVVGDLDQLSRYTPMPFGDVKRLRKFIRSQIETTVWDGNNHVPAPYAHAQELLERYRAAPARARGE